MGPAGRVQLVVGNRASVLVGAVGGQVLCSHTRGVLRWVEGGRGKRKETQEGLMLGKKRKEEKEMRRMR